MCQQQFCETGGVCPCSCAPPDTRVPPRCTLVATRVPLRAPRLPPEPDHGPGTETFVLGRDNKRPSRDRGPPNPPPHWAPAPQIRGGQRGEAEPPAPERQLPPGWGVQGALVLLKVPKTFPELVGDKAAVAGTPPRGSAPTQPFPRVPTLGEVGVLPRRGPQLYDTPYEEWETAGEGAGPAAARESRLPRDDERPADEYDQPWEWKKDHISRAFAVQFESPERSPSHPREPPRTPRPPAGARPGCPPSPGWYHGPIGRAGAETLLALCREGSFLVRDCETSPDDYSLSLRSSQGFVHVKLTRTRERHFVLGRAGAAFPSVPEAVRHYTARALPVRGARHLSLLYPVAAQPL
uniref:Src homology 2 domain containing transforming protein D n=1 Tax=Apteryx owenii TaxID=8824 RepID=A0A8B9S436_APTOW